MIRIKKMITKLSEVILKFLLGSFCVAGFIGSAKGFFHILANSTGVCLLGEIIVWTISTMTLLAFAFLFLDACTTQQNTAQENHPASKN